MGTKVEELLEKYKNILDLSEINGYINLSQDEIFSKPYHEKQQLACKIAQDALRIQLVYNEAFAINKWAESTLKAILAEGMAKSGGYMYEEKFYLALSKAGQYAQQLEELRQLAGIRANMLNFISERLKYISTVISPKYGENQQREIKS